MSEIKVGDLVVVNKPASHGPCGLGLIFRVTNIRHPERGSSGRAWRCSFCGKSGIHQPGVGRPGGLVEGYRRTKGMPLWRLKRIPPLSELDDVKRDEEITA